MGIKANGIWTESLGLVRGLTPWIGVILLILLGTLFSGCKPTTSASAKEKPAKVEKIDGSDLSRIVLTEKAIQRIDLQTVPLRLEKVLRTRRVGGEVVASPVKATATTASATPVSALRVKISLSKGELSKVNRTQAARVVSLAQGDAEDQDDLTAELAGVEDDAEDSDDVTLQYALKGKPSLAAGERVFVELPLGNAQQRLIVPHSAVIYDLKGEAWVYINPEPRTFVRHRVTVDYIDEEMAVLSAGPPPGTTVVTDGAAELFGSEFGVGK